jgi:outer membrane lipoprotein-sorting protein
MRSGISLLLLTFAGALNCIHPHLCWAQDATAESLLKAAASKIRNLDKYTVEFVRYDESDRNRAVHHRRISFARPFRFRIEDLAPPTETIPAADGKVISAPACGRFGDVVNGDQRWSYNKDLKQYSKRAFDPHKEDPAVQFALSKRDDPDEVIIERDETLSLGGRQYDCTVVRARYPTGAYLTAWIDKAQGFIVKFSATASQPHVRTTTVEVLSIDANPALPDDLFTFEPPENWHQSSTYRCSPALASIQPM